MLSDERMDAVVGGVGRSQRRVGILFVLLVAVGASAFVAGISGPQAMRAWQAYLVNFVFWSGLAFGSVLFVAVLNLTNARWARSMKRLAEAPAAFLPLSFLFFWILFFGRGELFPWIREPVEGKEAWLSAGFLFARDGAGLFLLTAVASAMVGLSVRSDNLQVVAGARDGGPIPPETQRRVAALWRAQTVLSPILGILYAVVLSLVSFDLIMSLDPHWHSTLFGAYFFVGSFYCALAAIMLLGAAYRKSLGGWIQQRHFQDLGKLILGFCLLTGDFFYSQFLVIWYGNLPGETRYVLERVHQPPWQALAWVVLGVCFAAPFVVLLSRRVKLKAGPMAALAVAILAGMWLERLLLVAPSLWEGGTLPVGPMEAAITAGFLGAFGLTTRLFLMRVPLLPLSDPLFRLELERGSRPPDRAEARQGGGRPHSKEAGR